MKDEKETGKHKNRLAMDEKKSLKDEKEHWKINISLILCLNGKIQFQVDNEVSKKKI